MILRELLCSSLQQEKMVARWCFFLMLLIVLLLSLMPASIEVPTTGWDKGNHLLAFMLLGLAGRWAWPRTTAAMMFFLLIYGTFIEVVQSFTPHRLFEMSDIFFDGLGIIFGVILFFLFSCFRQLIEFSTNQKA